VGRDCKIILDNCDGYGTTVDGVFIDSLADMSCVSFHAAHIITMGEGGAVLTNNEIYADRVKKLREWGRVSGTDKIYEYAGFPNDYRERYVYEEIGYNLKPLELQCAIGRIQLTKLQDFKDKRRHNFNYLMEIFKRLPNLYPVTYLENSDPCWFSFPFMCRKVSRKLVMDTLEANNIECRTIFSGNILKHPAYEGVNITTPNDHNRIFQNATDIMFNGVFISVHPSITPAMMDFIGEVLRSL
jgi:CDP-6-deoxy-D-xylo-4-hexulose-3-dehydrase